MIFLRASLVGLILCHILTQPFVTSLGHFHFGKYIDSVMQSRVTALGSRSFKEKLRGIDEDMIWNNVIFRDRTSQDYILLAMKHYTTGLKIDTKHVYQALPRLLSLWFDFVSIQQGHIRVDDFKDNLKSENLGKPLYFLLIDQSLSRKVLTCYLMVSSLFVAESDKCKQNHGDQSKTDTSCCILYCNASANFSCHPR